MTTPSYNGQEEFLTGEGLSRNDQLLAIENYETPRSKGGNKLRLFHGRHVANVETDVTRFLDILYFNCTEHNYNNHFGSPQRTIYSRLTNCMLHFRNYRVSFAKRGLRSEF